MSVLGMRIVTVLAVTAMLAGGPASLEAQIAQPAPNIDSLTAVLDDADVSSRSMAVAALSAAPLPSLPGSTRVKLAALLEREATAPRQPATNDGEDSELGLYVTQLVRLVVKFQDPGSARALALVGIASNGDAQRFVASLGDASVALLDEAERTDTTIVSAVAATRGRMLGDFASALSPASRLLVRRKVLDLSQRKPLAFARAARFARMVETAPLVADLARTASSDFQRSVLENAVQQLTAARTQTSTEDIVTSLSASLAALCDRAEGARFGACQKLGAILSQTVGALQAAQLAQARQHLAVLAKAATETARQGTFTSAEAAMLSGTATYLTTRM